MFNSEFKYLNVFVSLQRDMGLIVGCKLEKQLNLMRFLYEISTRRISYLTLFMCKHLLVLNTDLAPTYMKVFEVVLVLKRVNGLKLTRVMTSYNLLKQSKENHRWFKKDEIVMKLDWRGMLFIKRVLQDTLVIFYFSLFSRSPINFQQASFISFPFFVCIFFHHKFKN